MPFTLVGGLGGFALVLIATFGRKQDNPAIVLSYAALEGLFLGAVSFLFANLVSTGGAGHDRPGDRRHARRVLRHAGRLQDRRHPRHAEVHPHDRRRPVRRAGPDAAQRGARACSASAAAKASACAAVARIAIVFSLVCIALAAFSFLIDFDAADQMIRAGAPEKAALGHRARPDRHAGLAVPRNPASAELLPERLAAATPGSPFAYCERAFCCSGVCPALSSSAHRSRFIAQIAICCSATSTAVDAGRSRRNAARDTSDDGATPSSAARRSPTGACRDSTNCERDYRRCSPTSTCPAAVEPTLRRADAAAAWLWSHREGVIAGSRRRRCTARSGSTTTHPSS